jgi:hypothetical protein
MESNNMPQFSEDTANLHSGAANVLTALVDPTPYEEGMCRWMTQSQGYISDLIGTVNILNREWETARVELDKEKAMSQFHRDLHTKALEKIDTIFSLIREYIVEEDLVEDAEELIDALVNLGMPAFTSDFHVTARVAVELTMSYENVPSSVTSFQLEAAVHSALEDIINSTNFEIDSISLRGLDDDLYPDRCDVDAYVVETDAVEQ